MIVALRLWGNGAEGLQICPPALRLESKYWAATYNFMVYTQRIHNITSTGKSRRWQWRVTGEYGKPNNKEREKLSDDMESKL